MNFRRLNFASLVRPILWVAVGVVVNTTSIQARAAYGFGHESGAENAIPKQLADVGITEHLGNQVNLDLPFRDESGKTVTLRDFMRDGKPMLLSLAYFGCPSLCSAHLNGLNTAFKQIKEPLGQNFKFVVVSIEPKETSELAGKKKEAYMKAYARPEGDAGWHFLVGNQPEITALANQVGFNYHWDAQENQYAHASAAYVLTADGTISRYFYGIVFRPKDLRLSMIEASNGKVGTIIDKLTLYCSHFDAGASKYTIAAFSVLRVGAILITLLLGAFLVPFWFRKDRLEGEA